MFEYRSLIDRPHRDPLAWDDLLRGFDQIFRELDRDAPLTSFGYAPAELAEEENRFVLRVEMPGVKDQDVRVDLQQGVLTVSAERSLAAPEGYQPRRRERAALQMSRSYVLGDRVDPEKTTAELKDGVLTVAIAKAESSKKKSIAVRTS